VRYRQVQVISGKGTGPDRFTESLRGIAVDAAGLIYAVGDCEVKVFDPKGALRRRWRTGAPGYCVAVENDTAPEGDRAVYVGQAGQVEKFDPTGKLLSTLRDGDRLGRVTTIGLFERYVLVADATHRCIRRYNKDGNFLNDIGNDDRMKGFLIPNGHLDFSIDARGMIHAANPGKHRVQRYTLTGELLGHFGRFGAKNPEDFPGCCNPTNLTVTERGHVVVTEKAPARAKVYDDDGKLISVIGTEAFDQNCKNMDVATDSQGHIYIVDTVGLRIQVFAWEEKQTVASPVAAPASVSNRSRELRSHE